MSKAPPPQQNLPDIYRPLEPIKKFEPLQPFAPLGQFEAPKSFELAKQIEANIQSEKIKGNTEQGTENINSENFQPDLHQTETATGTINAAIEDAAQFSFIKPLELPATIDGSNQYEPLKPFNVTDEKIISDSASISNENDVRTQSHTFQPIEAPEKSTLSDTVLSQDTVESITVPEEPFELRTSTGELYQPVVALEPLNLDDYLKPIVLDMNQNSEAEIKQHKIKESLKEIISDLDTYAEKDKELKDSLHSNERYQNGLTEEIERTNKQRQVRYRNFILFYLICCVC